MVDIPKKNKLVLVLSLFIWGGCGADSMAPNVGESSDIFQQDEGAQFTDAPIDIPVPVAKVIDGVDATSLECVETGLTDPICILRGKILGDEDRDVAAYLDGEELTLQKTIGRFFQIGVPASAEDRDILLMVAVDGLYSYPVSIRIAPKKEPFDHHPLVNRITNASRFTSINPADLQPSGLVFSPEGHFLAASHDSEGKPFISRIGLANGNEPVATNRSSGSLRRLRMSADKNLYGMDKGYLYKLGFIPPMKGFRKKFSKIPFSSSSNRPFFLS